MQGDVARGAARAFAAVVVDHGDAVPGIRPAHAAGARRPARGAVADDVVDLGLAEHLVRHDAEPVAAPGEDGVADRFAGAHDGAQLQVEAAARIGHRLHHRLERGGEEKAVRHPVRLQQGERGLRCEPPLVGDDLAAEVERRQERVHQAAGPRPVRRRPEHRIVLRKPVLAADEARQVADQHPVRQRACPWAGRSCRWCRSGRRHPRRRCRPASAPRPRHRAARSSRRRRGPRRRRPRPASPVAGRAAAPRARCRCRSRRPGRGGCRCR